MTEPSRFSITHKVTFLGDRPPSREPGDISYVLHSERRQLTSQEEWMREMSDRYANGLPERAGGRQQLPGEVASYVRELIVSGAVRPGDFLRMEPIAEAVGVSNTPVREGLLALQSEGFVRLEPRRGFVVAPFSEQDVRDIFWAQAQLGGELAARAAKRRTQDVLDRLTTNLESYEAALARGDDAKIEELGHLFHREINRAANSTRLALLMGSVVRHLPNRFYAAIEGQVEGAHNEHPMLLDALRRGDARSARSIMQRHILAGADHLVDSLNRLGLWSADRT